jgi:GNAT superfamily N-acetyltransferase|tara:strand:- start:356892 stop:357395 length:504 start_codon:yes stop_codon:yes gene_type:complete
MASEITIKDGYRDELIGNITALHSRIYSDIAGFGAFFEALVATNYANFINRLEHPDNATWYADCGGEIVGGISIDGQDLKAGQAHLRWFIVSDNVQSKGVGRKLLKKALDFSDQREFKEIHLWTFKGLEAARKLYEDHGFVLVEEQHGTQYGTRVLEQRFVRLYHSS